MPINNKHHIIWTNESWWASSLSQIHVHIINSMNKEVQLALLYSVQQSQLNFLNTLRPRQDGRCFPDDNFQCIFLNEDVWIFIKIPLNFVSKSPINITGIPALVQVMAWRQPGDKPLSEPVMVSLLTHLCVTWPQWVNVQIFCLQQSMTMSGEKLGASDWQIIVGSHFVSYMQGSHYDTMQYTQDFNDNLQR